MTNLKEIKKCVVSNQYCKLSAQEILIKSKGIPSCELLDLDKKELKRCKQWREKIADISKKTRDELYR